jgi:UDP:flavonoid glycosyltransferase YjiC (YdhE family)
MDYSRAFDRFLQLTVPEFEYPRSDLAPNTEFIGPVLGTNAHTTLPDWWDSLDRRRPVVYVTQGTIDNHDPGRLILPTIQALRSREVTLIVTTGSQAAGDTLIRNLPGGVPDNVKVASFLPYGRLLPAVDLMITNGGYGGVQHALAHGIPLIAAGDREDKPEVCARIAYSGAGINLRTGEPTPEAVGAAVRQALTDARYRANAERIAASIASHDPHAAIEQAILLCT